MFTSQDIEQMQSKGISAEVAQGQLKRFAEGFPYLRLRDSARIGQGICRLDDAEIAAAEERW